MSRTINEIIVELEMLHGFVISESTDGKINNDTSREIIRMLSEIKDKAISEL